MAAGLEDVTTLHTTAGSLLSATSFLTSSNYKPPVLQALSLCNSCSPRAKFKLICTTS